MLRTSICMLALLLLPAIASAAPLARHMKLEQTVEVKPLADPGNPYRDMYADWDRWLVEHYVPYDENDPFPTEDRFANQYVLEGRVDSNGWLLPQVELQRHTAQWYKDGSHGMLNGVYPYRFHGTGAMEEPMLRAAREAFARARAPFYPDVPQWLAVAKPEWSFILPDGRVVTTIAHGGADFWPGLEDWSAPDSTSFGWQLFTPAGDFISASLPQSWWWEVTIPDFRQRIEPYRKPLLNVVEKYGHIHVYDMQTHATYANFDWDGTPLQANLKLHDGRDGVPFLGISGWDLPVIYDEQQRLTKTQ
jgi:hypothetical protein